MASVLELQEAITDAACDAARAARGLVLKVESSEAPDDASLAVQARECASAARELCAALMDLQGRSGIVRAPVGEPPDLYPPAARSSAEASPAAQ